MPSADLFAAEITRHAFHLHHPGSYLTSTPPAPVHRGDGTGSDFKGLGEG